MRNWFLDVSVTSPRTASQNGGIALGRERVFQETGIKESDWLRKFWRWSDAVKDASCVPSQLSARVIPDKPRQKKAARQNADDAQQPA